MKKAILFTLSACCLIYSCSTNKEAEDQTAEAAQYKLVKVDSLLIQVSEPLQITDQHPDNGNFLAYGIASQKCFELDRNGLVLSEADLSGEGPGRFGKSMSELGYLGDTKVINGPNTYLLFDDEWNYQTKLVYDNDGTASYFGYIAGAPLTVDVAGDPLIIRATSQSLFDFKKLEPDHFSSAPVATLHATKAKVKAVLNYPTSSIYQSQDTYYIDHSPLLSFNRQEGLLYMAMPLEQKLYVYDMKQEALVQTIDIKLNSFKDPQGIPFADQGKEPKINGANELSRVYQATNSAIKRINSAGVITIIEHKTGTRQKTGLTNYKVARQRAKEENKNYTSFIKEGKTIYETEQVFKRLVRLSENRFMIENIDKEVERDYNQYDIYELQKVQLTR